MATDLRLFVITFLLALFPATPFAADYGLFISISDEDDLLDLLNSGEIDEDTYNTLNELLHDPVDLNVAGREILYSLPNLTYEEVDAILKYRAEVASIYSLEDLVAAGVLTPEKAEALRPFVVIRPSPLSLLETKGRLRAAVTYLAGDEGAPPTMFSARLTTLQYLDIGVASVLKQNQLQNVQFDETRQALFADPPSTRFRVPKYFAKWEDKTFQMVLGTFRIGFGQRLTLDNTGLEKPNGALPDDTILTTYDLSLACRESSLDLKSPCTSDARYSYETPDFRWTDRFRGLAVGLKGASVGPGLLQVYAFASYQTHDIYQYEIYDASRCPDPTEDDNPSCSAPWVLRWRGDPLAPTTRFSYETLPEMYNQLTIGGNASYLFNERTHIGLTGYGAKVYWLVRGISLDFQEWSRVPYGGPFGAIGADAAFGLGPVDLALEFARSFDSQPAGGGYAGLILATLTLDSHEVEVSGRFYDINYANPLARPISEPDEYDGLRARDEVGGRIKYSGAIGRLSLRSSLDIWTFSTGLDGPKKLRFATRADYKLLRSFHPGLLVEFNDRDLRHSGRGSCYEKPYQFIGGEPVPCTGERVQAGLVLRLPLHRRLTLLSKYIHRFVDDDLSRLDPATGQRYKVFENRFRQDLITYFQVTFRPFDPLRFRLRLRYLNEDLSARAYLEESLWGFLEVSYRIRGLAAATLRYDVYGWLDKRVSTRLRSPNPAHWLRANLEISF